MNRIKLLFLMLCVLAMVSLTTLSQTVSNPNPKALDAMSKGDFRGAIAILDRDIRDSKNMFESYKLRSDVKSIIGDFAGSLTDLDKAIELKASDGSLYERRSRLRMMQRYDMKDVLADLDAAISYGVKYEKVYAQRGWIRAGREDFDGAMADYQAALAIRPGYAQAVMGISSVFMRKGEDAKAIETLENFFAILESSGKKPASVKGTATVSTAVDVPEMSNGKTMVRQGTVIYKDDTDFNGPPTRERIDRMNDRMEQSKNTATAYTTLAKLYDKRGDHELALVTVEKGIAIDPSDFYGYGTRGTIKTSLHNYAGAIADLNLAIKAMPADGIMYLDRGIAYLLSGKEAEAQKDFDQYLKMYPNGKANLDKRIEEARKMGQK